jgi:hypothetical protein
VKRERERERVEQAASSRTRAPEHLERMIVTVAIHRRIISLSRFASQSLWSTSRVRLLCSSSKAIPPPVSMADRIAEIHANAVVERGERRDSEMGDDWADTFVDSTPKFDPSTYNKRELAHRLESHKLLATSLICLRPWPSRVMWQEFSISFPTFHCSSSSSIELSCVW